MLNDYVPAGRFVEKESGSKWKKRFIIFNIILASIEVLVYGTAALYKPASKLSENTASTIEQTVQSSSIAPPQTLEQLSQSPNYQLPHNPRYISTQNTSYKTNTQTASADDEQR